MLQLIILSCRAFFFFIVFVLDSIALSILGVMTNNQHHNTITM